MDTSGTTRTESRIVEVSPERKEAAIRRQQEFGWILATAQSGTTMRDGRVVTLAKLLFTRTAQAEWITDMDHLEEEFEALSKSVRIGSDGLVLVGNTPSLIPPIPILIVITFAGYLVGWFAFDVVPGIATGILTTAFAWIAFRQKAVKKIRRHRIARTTATDEFRRKRSELLARIRAHAHTQNSPS